MKTCDSRFHQCLYFVSSALSRKVEKLAAESWKPAGISPSHGYLLLTIITEPGVQPSYLVDQLQLTPSTITRLMDKLEEKKLLVRTTEGKITNVYPTPKAKGMLPLLQQCVANFTAQCQQLLGPQANAALVSQMGQVADQLSG